MVWFVAKHKEVSRFMKLIDDSKSRAARQQVPESLISELQHDNLLPHSTQKKEILLDVFGNVPLKLYDVTLHSINDITMDTWTPKLHLTTEEQEIVNGEGTVLVLGRSGTGKVNTFYPYFRHLNTVFEFPLTRHSADLLYLHTHRI